MQKTRRVGKKDYTAHELTMNRDHDKGERIRMKGNDAMVR